MKNTALKTLMADLNKTSRQCWDTRILALVKAQKQAHEQREIGKELGYRQGYAAAYKEGLKTMVQEWVAISHEIKGKDNDYVIDTLKRYAQATQFRLEEYYR